MKREIKFRFWDKDEKRYFEPEIAVFSPDGRIIDVNAVIVGEECIIEQFTGLKDKNGKEIYEGDKIRCRDLDSLHYMNDPYDPDYFVVQYDERHNGFNSFPKWDDEEMLNKLIDSFGGLITWPNENILACHWHFEIIGTIHDQ